MEIGSGTGNFAEFRDDVVSTDRWVEPWLDVACDAYRLPFGPGRVSHLILVDVFHHLSAPAAFFEEAGRVMAPRARVILFEPFISLISAMAYGLFHPEPIGWKISMEDHPSGNYYAAQANATRLLFADTSWLPGWSIERRQAFSAFAYLLSGGFSWPALYPRRALPLLLGLDRKLSRFPRVFGARCLIVLSRNAA
ncbi:MAG TPA: methyltransferase domain-containing protein [Thermoanaerobaculia bacterium]|nr:methyltransferase domain-containing protein [Thermoanaerobaculia bacterium]